MIKSAWREFREGLVDIVPVAAAMRPLSVRVTTVPYGPLAGVGVAVNDVAALVTVNAVVSVEPRCVASPE